LGIPPAAPGDLLEGLQVTIEFAVGFSPLTLVGEFDPGLTWKPRLCSSKLRQDPARKFLSNSFQNRRQPDHNRICFGSHLGIGGILNGMRNEEPSGIFQTQSPGLGNGRLGEFQRGYRQRRNPLNLEPDHIVQTARRARPSVG